MNLFEDKNIITEFNKCIKSYAWNNNLRVISKEIKWDLFEKDELKVKIILIESNNKKRIEYRTPLFEQIDYSLEIMIRFICGEKYIRDIARTDLIDSYDGKIDLVRYCSLTNKSNTNVAIAKNIKSLIKRAERLKDEISSRVDIILQIKLN